MKIPLFDLDGTLLKSGNTTHSVAFHVACQTVYGVDVSATYLEMQGMIDTQILIQLLKLHGIDEEQTKAKMPQAIDVMADYFQKHKHESPPILLPGVKELLDILEKHAIPMGLLTGNVASIGWGKLEQVGIKKYFTFGAFGNMAYKREDLISLAYKELKKIHPGDFNLLDLVIIGDTPRDIYCAKAHQLKVLSVATGMYSAEQLEKEGADLVINSLEDQKKILQFLET